MFPNITRPQLRSIMLIVHVCPLFPSTRICNRGHRQRRASSPHPLTRPHPSPECRVRLAGSCPGFRPAVTLPGSPPHSSSHPPITSPSRRLSGRGWPIARSRPSGGGGELGRVRLQDGAGLPVMTHTSCNGAVLWRNPTRPGCHPALDVLDIFSNAKSLGLILCLSRYTTELPVLTRVSFTSHPG